MKSNLALSWRALLAYMLIFLMFLFVVLRIFEIQFNDRDFLDSKAQKMLLSSRNIPTLRAGIYDRNNFPLAVSVTQYNLFALRNFSADNYEAINAIAPIQKTFKQIDGLRRKSVLFLNLDFSQYEEIQKLRLDSIEIESVQKRYYPLGEQIAPLIGFAGRDGVGTDGLEKILNTQLSGISGSEIVLKNASRKPQVVTPAIPGVAFK